MKQQISLGKNRRSAATRKLVGALAIMGVTLAAFAQVQYVQVGTLPAPASTDRAEVFDAATKTLYSFPFGAGNAVYFSRHGTNDTFAWTQTTSFNNAVTYWGRGAANGTNLYFNGNIEDINFSRNSYAPLNVDGSLGAWQATTPLPVPGTGRGRSLHQTFIYNGRLYVLGGWHGDSEPAYADVYYATIQTNGSVGSFTQTTSLPTGYYGHTTTVSQDGRLYFIAGSNIYLAQILPDGSITAFVQQTTVSGLNHQDYGNTGAAIVSNILVIADSAVTRIVRLNASGQVQSLVTNVPNPTNFVYRSLYAHAGVVYVTSGHDTKIYRISPLPVGLPPTITQQPVTQAAREGAEVALTVVATSDSPIGYQWYFNGGLLGGAVSPTLTVNPVTTNQAGNYFAVLVNQFGSTTSAVARLQVVSPSFPGNIAFSYKNSLSDRYDLWMIAPDGSGMTNISRTPEIDEFEPRFSPSAGAVAYVAVNSTNPAGDGLWVMDVDGERQRQLVRKIDYGNTPVYSPTWLDDDTILFSVQGANCDSTVYKVSLSEGVTRIAFTVTNALNVFNRREAAVTDISPDRTRLLMCAAQDCWAPTFNVYSTGINGSNAAVVYADNNPDDFRDPVAKWSPQGNQIAFSHWLTPGANQNPEHMAVAVIGVASNGFRILTGPTEFCHVQDWVPDGSKILFLNAVSYGDPGGNVSDNLGNLWLMDSFGSNRAQLTFLTGRFPMHSIGGGPRSHSSWSRIPALRTVSDCAPAPQGLIGWWAGDGNANDSQGTNHGTLENGATIAPGKAAGAFKMSDHYQWARVPFHPSLDFASNSAFTLLAWVLPSDTGAFQAVAVKCPLSGAWDWGLYVNPQGYFMAGSQFAHAVVSTNRVQFGKWQHVAFTYQSGVWQLYVSGQLEGQNQNIPVGQSTGLLGIGRKGDSGTFDDGFRGSVDEVQIFNRALTAAEIGMIGAAGGSGLCKQPSFVSIGKQNDGSMLLRMKGQTGRNLSVLTSTTLSNWLPWASSVYNGGTNEVLDSAAATNSLNFYRLRQP